MCRTSDWLLSLQRCTSRISKKIEEHGTYTRMEVTGWSGSQPKPWSPIVSPSRWSRPFYWRYWRKVCWQWVSIFFDEHHINTSRIGWVWIFPLYYTCKAWLLMYLRRCSCWLYRWHCMWHLGSTGPLSLRRSCSQKVRDRACRIIARLIYSIVERELPLNWHVAQKSVAFPGMASPKTWTRNLLLGFFCGGDVFSATS